MAKVFCIYEECHGFIGVATTPNAVATGSLIVIGLLE